jgi:hypothetical protein
MAQILTMVFKDITFWGLREPRWRDSPSLGTFCSFSADWVVVVTDEFMREKVYEQSFFLLFFR